MPFEEKIKNEVPLSSNEVYQLLQYLINQSRIECGVYNDDLMKCDKCTNWISRRLPNCSLIININGLGINSSNNFVHYFSLITLNTYKGNRSFLIDPVFDQFNTDKYKIGKNNYNSIEAFSKNSDFFNRLIKEKYFELTKENIIQYISGFVELCNMDNQNLDKNEIINNTLKFMDKLYTTSDSLFINEEKISKENRIKLIEILKYYKNTLEKQNNNDNNKLNIK